MFRKMAYVLSPLAALLVVSMVHAADKVPVAKKLATKPLQVNQSARVQPLNKLKLVGQKQLNPAVMPGKETASTKGESKAPSFEKKYDKFVNDDKKDKKSTPL